MANRNGCGVGCLLCAATLAKLSPEGSALAGALLVAGLGGMSLGDTLECEAHGELACRVMLTLGEIMTEAEREGKAQAAVTFAKGVDIAIVRDGLGLA